MTPDIARIREKVAAQKTLFPALYGNVDFDAIPERFTYDPSVAVVHDRAPLGVQVGDEDIERLRAYTMLGDVVADRYAALIPEFGFRRLIAMLTEACDKGVESVAGAPPELVAFIRSMEAKPAWIDMKMVEEGARLDLNTTANLAPWTIRGAFLATFLNKYAALPMALTGTLSNESAARRVNETATFFAVTVLPGALERHGEGFKAAAMVRLMHSMVRFNAMRSGRWDVSVYGMPIPQVDQMPAGLIGIFLMSFAILAKGRRTFTPAERAKVELARYRCFLLGLPEDLLADTPEGIVRTMTARNTTLRQDFEDATCGALIRATLSAYLPPDRSAASRWHDGLERRVAKVFFLKHFLKGDAAISEAIGVKITAGDRVVSALVIPMILTQMLAYKAADKIPGVRRLATKALVRKVERLLGRYGHAEFETDAAKYRPAVPTAAAA